MRKALNHGSLTFWFLIEILAQVGNSRRLSERRTYVQQGRALQLTKRPVPASLPGAAVSHRWPLALRRSTTSVESTELDGLHSFLAPTVFRYLTDGEIGVAGPSKTDTREGASDSGERNLQSASRPVRIESPLWGCGVKCLPSRYAFLLTSSLMMSSWPQMAAACSGVRPSLSSVSKSTPWFIKYLPPALHWERRVVTRLGQAAAINQEGQGREFHLVAFRGVRPLGNSLRASNCAWCSLVGQSKINNSHPSKHPQGHLLPLAELPTSLGRRNRAHLTMS